MNQKEYARSLVKFTAEQLFDMFQKYKIWIKGEGYIKREVVRYKDSYDIVDILIPKPMSLESFMLYNNINFQTYYDVMNNDSEAYDPKLVEMALKIRQEIRDFQIGGATAGNFNPSIVAKVNGLSDTINVNNMGGSKDNINITINAEDLKLK
jgi:hypothetical protein